MRSGFSFGLVVLVLLPVTGIGAQGPAGPADFDGSWVAETKDASSVGRRETIIVKQDKAGLTASFGSEGRSQKETIRIDFEKSRTEVRPGGGGNVEVTITASWAGKDLVTLNAIKSGSNSRSFEQRWSRAAADELVITTLRTVGTEIKSSTKRYRRMRPPSL